MSARKRLWVIVLGLVGAAAALWGSSALTWTDAPNPAKGSVAAPQLGALALFGLAALAASFAGGAVVKRVLGVLVLLSALFLVYLAITGVSAPPPSAQHEPADPAQLPFARGLAGLAALLQLAAAAVLIRLPHGLPRLGSKYSRTEKRTAVDPDQRLWEALSDGEDPTRGRSE